MEFKGTPGPWILCHHLESEEKDKSCPCGYRGGIWGKSGDSMICEMGSTVVLGEEALSCPRYERPVEIANSHLIAAAPDLLAFALDFIDKVDSGRAKSTDSYNKAKLAVSKALK